MTKTETKLLDWMEHDKLDKTSVFGKREVQAAEKLNDKGLAKFTNQSARVKNCAERKNGNYQTVFVYQGYLEKLL